MLTISKPLSSGQAASYHREEFANAKDNYYTEGDRVRGQWHGRLAEQWVLKGEVDAGQFKRLADGQHPLTGEQLVHFRAAHQYTDANGEQIVEVLSAPSTGMVVPNSGWLTVEVKRVPKSAIIWSAAASAVTTTGANPTQDTNLPYDVVFKPDGSATASTIYITDRNGTPHFYRVLVYHATGSSYARELW